MNRDGKPVFTSDHPNIFVRNLNHNVEVGTYVTYHHNNNYLYGRIVASSSATGSTVQTITVNQFFTRTELEKLLGSVDLLPSKISS